MSDKPFVVCGTIAAEDAQEAVCSKCGGRVWPTIGTLVEARAREYPLVCIECFQKMDQYQFGGVMHHGKMLGEARARAIRTALDAALRLMAREGKK